MGMGLYRASIRKKRTENKIAIARIQMSLYSLKNTKGAYYREHVELLSVYRRMESVLLQAKDDV